MAIEVTLDQLLAQREMTVAQLAAAIGITPANVFVLKNGRAKAVRFSTLDAICRVLDCQPADVLSYTVNDESRLPFRKLAVTSPNQALSCGYDPSS